MRLAPHYSIVMLALWKTRQKKKKHRQYLMIKVSYIVAVIQPEYYLVGIPGSDLWTKKWQQRISVCGLMGAWSGAGGGTGGRGWG